MPLGVITIRCPLFGVRWPSSGAFDGVDLHGAASSSKPPLLGFRFDAGISARMSAGPDEPCPLPTICPLPGGRHAVPLGNVGRSACRLIRFDPG